MASASSISEALEVSAGVSRLGFTFLEGDGGARDFTWSEISEQTAQTARALLRLGVRPGDRVAMLAEDPCEFALCALGAIRAGLVAVPLAPPPMLGAIDAYVERLGPMLEISGAGALLVPQRHLERLAASLQSYLAEPARVLSYDDVKRQHGGYAIAIPTTASADDPCFLQFTSGSTGRPRAVTVTHGNVLANTEATHRLLGTDPSEEIGVNWVPLYHDMGFVATLLAPTLGLGRHVFIPTSFFATRPRIWLETVHRYRGTMTTSNNFGLRIAAKRPPRIPDLDLSCVRALIVGSEPIKVDVLRTFEATYRAHGFDSRALCPAYGMAEATLVISMSPADETYSTAAISDGGEVVSCGRVLPGHEVMVLDDQGASGSTGIGELAYRGPSVTPGYWESSTGSTRTDGPRWLRTGDLGFVRDGQLYVCGRAKDVIIIGGRNYHPQAIEWCAEAVSGVQPDGVIAAAIPGETSDRVVIVAEVAGDTDLDATRRDIAWSIKNSFGFSPEAVCLIERWSLPRTTSGKRRRSDVAKAYLAGGLKQLARSGGHDERI